MNDKRPDPERDAERIIRVFVSSTFRDMQEERELLVKRVFPQLRKMCEERGVTWGEVDLRWGITEEQKSEGKVLPICLAEIQRSRPYFIGMLGERYGWIPDEIPAELLELEPWIGGHAGRSVTEMEILHGVLNDPAMENHAYFYLRNPAYAKQREGFAGESPEEQAKLADLKKRIRASGFPVREDYPDPKALSDLVLADFSALIDKLFPPRPADDFLTAERSAHKAFASSRSRAYIGRQEYFSRLDAQASGDGLPLAITGESGAGKSALLANWIESFQRRHPDRLMLEHFIGASASSTDWKSMLQRLTGEMQKRLGLSDAIPDESGNLRQFFAKRLHQGGHKGPLLLVIDALDQLDDRDEAPDLTWLGRELPAGIRLIVSTLPGRPLDEWRRRKWPEMEITPLDQDERRRLIMEYLAQYAKSLDRRRSEKVAAARLAGNPLYLRALLEELRLFGNYERLDQQLDHYLESADIPALFEKILERYEQDFDSERPNLVRDAMSRLWASRHGLSEAELLDMLGRDGSPLPRAYWSPLFLAAENSLVNRSGLLSFFHGYLRQAVEKRYLAEPGKRKSIHLSLANYFKDYALQRSPRMVAEFPWQSFKAESWEWLARFLADEELLLKAWNANDYDVSAYWTALEGHGYLLEDVYRSVIRTPMLRTNARILGIVASLLDNSGKLQLASELFLKMAELSRQQGDYDNLLEALGCAGNTLVKLGKQERALALFKEQEQIARDRGDLGGLSIALMYQGRISVDMGDLDQALALHKEQEAICRQLGNAALLAHALPNQALIHVEHGNYDEALKVYEECDRLFRETGQQEFYCENLMRMGNLFLTMNETDRALVLLKEAEELSQRFGGEEQQGKSWNLQAWAWIKKNKLEKARQLLDHCEAFWSKREEKRHLADIFHYRAMISFIEKDLDAALRFLKESANLFDRFGYMRNAVSIKEKIVGIYDAKGMFHDSLKTRLAIVDVQRKIGNKKKLCENLGRIGSLCHEFEMIADAKEYYLKHIALCRELHLEKGIATSLQNLGLIHYINDDFPQAQNLYAEVETIYRRQQNKVRLADVLGIAGDILAKMNQSQAALVKQKERAAICREQNLMEGLAGALINQAMILAAGKRFFEAKPLAEESYALASRHGSVDFAKQVKEVLDMIRNVC